jgi:hypothetical protein
MLLASQPAGIWSAAAGQGEADKMPARRTAQIEICQRNFLVVDIILSPGARIKHSLWLQYHEDKWL